MSPTDPALLEAALQGDRRALSRLLSLASDQPSDQVLAALGDRPRTAHVVGVTGPPGVGKSSLVDRILSLLRARGLRPGVVAIDPSSPFSGGALLGDRVRMQQHSGDPDVFIRSMANRGRLGGIAAGTEPAVAILAAAGYDPVIVETVGVGQAELEVVNLADTVVLVVAPTFGDDVSAAKAGLFEIGDVYCVNQADRGEAGAAISRLRAVVSADSVGGGQPPIVVTSALTGEGVEELWEAVSAHRAASPRSGGGGRPRKLGLGGS